MVRVLHIADVHMDRAFRGQAFTGCDGARRRELLRSALEWAVDTAVERQADVLTVGGDLFEAEHVTSDTIAFIARQFERAEMPVLVVAGNHDAAGPSSPYRTTAWPANVTLALDPAPRPLEVGEAILWSLGYTGNEIDDSGLRGLRLPDRERRVNILVAHGVDVAGLSPEWRWGGLNLNAGELRRIGFDHALLGHIHAGHVGEVMSWPGSMVPLNPGETTGNHGALFVEADPGRVVVTPIEAGFCRFETASIDITEISDSTELEGRVRHELLAMSARDALVTCRLWGRRRTGLAVDTARLEAAAAETVLGVQVIDATAPAADLEALAAEPNARGKAIAELLHEGSPQAAMAAGLIAEAFEADLRLPA